MDIQSAAHYLKVGYRIRRGCWEQDEYLADVINIELRKMQVEYPLSYNHRSCKFEKQRLLRNNEQYCMDVSELLANDWEVVWDGIKTHCNVDGVVEYLDS